MRLSFRSFLHYYPKVAQVLQSLFAPNVYSCYVLKCSSDPDEVIYDDVPRENSDSNTGSNFLFQVQHEASSL